MWTQRTNKPAELGIESLDSRMVLRNRKNKNRRRRLYGGPRLLLWLLTFSNEYKGKGEKIYA